MEHNSHCYLKDVIPLPQRTPVTRSPRRKLCEKCVGRVRIENSCEWSNRQDAMLGEQNALKLAGEARNARVVGGVAPVAPVEDALGLGSVPVAIQLPVNVLETSADEMWRKGKDKSKEGVKQGRNEQFTNR